MCVIMNSLAVMMGSWGQMDEAYGIEWVTCATEPFHSSLGSFTRIYIGNRRAGIL